MTHPPWDPFDLASEVKEARRREASRSASFIVIDYRSNQGDWRAWWTDKVSLLGKLEGTREEVIAWARERCDDILICSDPYDDDAPMVELGPDDQ